MVFSTFKNGIWEKILVQTELTPSLINLVFPKWAPIFKIIEKKALGMSWRWLSTCDDDKRLGITKKTNRNIAAWIFQNIISVIQKGALLMLMFQVLQERLFPFSSLHAHYLKHHTMQCIVAWWDNLSNSCTPPPWGDDKNTLYSGLRTSMGQFWMTSSTTSDRGVVKSGLQNWNKTK